MGLMSILRKDVRGGEPITTRKGQSDVARGTSYGFGHSASKLVGLVRPEPVSHHAGIGGIRGVQVSVAEVHAFGEALIEVRRVFGLAQREVLRADFHVLRGALGKHRLRTRWSGVRVPISSVLEREHL
jgi:hypothetical protein